MTSRRNSIGCTAQGMGGSRSLCSHAPRHIRIRRAMMFWVSQPDPIRVESPEMRDETTDRARFVQEQSPPRRRALDWASGEVDGDPRQHPRPVDDSWGLSEAVSWPEHRSTAQCPTWRSDGRHGLSQRERYPRVARIALIHAQDDGSRRGTAGARVPYPGRLASRKRSSVAPLTASGAMNG